ncbi:odorant receptor 131-2-like [Erpetoichthys calabaricus]|uniref:odorant receptor 131-2-like n=1 Tax=Erpetoichthys calabaricus TaxID=27687 RepID=UPI0022345A5E|nr:odorant receptor 131-2-like [Erpetoichthys calabaricus]
MNNIEYTIQSTQSTDELSIPGFSNQTKSILKISLVLLFYIVTNYINGKLIAVFFKHHIFHRNPRYILFMHIVLNDVMEISIAIFMHIWAEIVYIMPVSLCYFLMAIAVTTTYNTPLNLALMAVERYIAICKPLHHPNICTFRRTYIILNIIWLISFLSPASDLIIILNAEPMSFFSTKIICYSESFVRTYFLSVKRSCMSLTYFAVAWLTMAYTYIHIVIAARSVSH